jgi:hypothetical protein
VFSDEANKECIAYLNNVASFINGNGGTQIGSDDLLDITLHTLTEDPK